MVDDVLFYRMNYFYILVINLSLTSPKYGEEPMSKKLLGRRLSRLDVDEFRSLVKNLVPASLEQAEWICSEVERILHEHPELMVKIEEWIESSDGDGEEAKRLITSMLREIRSERVNAYTREDAGKG